MRRVGPAGRRVVHSSTGVLRDEQVEAFFLTYLTDHDARWAHPQRLLDETSQLDLTSALETRLAALHRHDVGQRDL